MGKFSRLMKPRTSTRTFAHDFPLINPNPPMMPGNERTARKTAMTVPTSAVIAIASASPDKRPPPAIARKTTTATRSPKAPNTACSTPTIFV